MEEIIKTENGIQVTRQVIETLTIDEIKDKISEKADAINNYELQKAQLDLKIEKEQKEINRFLLLKKEYER